MRSLAFGADRRTPLRILCLGAHSDDLEIGCGGAILTWLNRYPGAEVTWVVFSAPGPRAGEARRSARALLRATPSTLVLHRFKDGHFPSEFQDLKATFEDLKGSLEPDLILTHRLEDRHQDHRVVAELTWQTWRDHLILEYEIPKYDGDLGQPNLYVPIEATVAARKVRHLMKHFGTQRSRGWFRPETFDALLHLRGIECRAPSGRAEAFHARKVRL